jgi:hypothetical protein
MVVTDVSRMRAQTEPPMKMVTRVEATKAMKSGPLSSDTLFYGGKRFRVSPQILQLLWRARKFHDAGFVERLPADMADSK